MIYKKKQLRFTGLKLVEFFSFCKSEIQTSSFCIVFTFCHIVLIIWNSQSLHCTACTLVLYSNLLIPNGEPEYRQQAAPLHSVKLRIDL